MTSLMMRHGMVLAAFLVGSVAAQSSNWVDDTVSLLSRKVHNAKLEGIGMADKYVHMDLSHIHIAANGKMDQRQHDYLVKLHSDFFDRAWDSLMAESSKLDFNASILSDPATTNLISLLCGQPFDGLSTIMMAGSTFYFLSQGSARCAGNPMACVRMSFKLVEALASFGKHAADRQVCKSEKVMKAFESTTSVEKLTEVQADFGKAACQLSSATMASAAVAITVAGLGYPTGVCDMNKYSDEHFYGACSLDAIQNALGLLGGASQMYLSTRNFKGVVADFCEDNFKDNPRCTYFAIRSFADVFVSLVEGVGAVRCFGSDDLQRDSKAQPCVSNIVAQAGRGLEFLASSAFRSMFWGGASCKAYDKQHKSKDLEKKGDGSSGADQILAYAGALEASLMVDGDSQKKTDRENDLAEKVLTKSEGLLSSEVSEVDAGRIADAISRSVDKLQSTDDSKSKARNGAYNLLWNVDWQDPEDIYRTEVAETLKKWGPIDVKIQQLLLTWTLKDIEFRRAADNAAKKTAAEAALKAAQDVRDEVDGGAIEVDKAIANYLVKQALVAEAKYTREPNFDTKKDIAKLEDEATAAAKAVRENTAVNPGRQAMWQRKEISKAEDAVAAAQDLLVTAETPGQIDLEVQSKAAQKLLEAKEAPPVPADESAIADTLVKLRDAAQKVFDAKKAEVPSVSADKKIVIAVVAENWRTAAEKALGKLKNVAVASRFNSLYYRSAVKDAATKLSAADMAVRDSAFEAWKVSDGATKEKYRDIAWKYVKIVADPENKKRTEFLAALEVANPGPVDAVSGGTVKATAYANVIIEVLKFQELGGPEVEQAKQTLKGLCEKSPQFAKTVQDSWCPPPPPPPLTPPSS